MIYAFITEHAEHPAARWATFFEVSTSGYYSWLENQPDRQSRLDAYAGEVERIFDDSGGTYGADRIAGEMRKQGLKASFRKVKHIMQDKGLYSVHLSYQRCLTDSRNARDDHYVNLLRDADINEPFQALSSDISYIPTNEGFEYTCTIRDILSGLVLSEHTAARMTKELVMETIRSASKQWSLPKVSLLLIRESLFVMSLMNFVENSCCCPAGRAALPCLEWSSQSLQHQHPPA